MSKPSDGKNLVVADAVLWDGTGTAPEPHQMLEIRDGRIVKRGSLKTATLPKDLPRLEADGRFVMPGLIDCHVHLSYSRFNSLADADHWPVEYHTLRAAENAAAVLSYGYTTIRDVGARGAIAVALRDAINEGLIPGPRIVASGQIISSSSGMAAVPSPWITNERGFGLAVDGVDALRKAVRTQFKMGVDNIKVGVTGAEASPHITTEQTTYSPQELAAITDEARRFNRTVACHAQSYLGARMAVEAGVTTVEHGTRLDDETIALLVRAQDTYLVPTLCTIFSWLELSKNPKAVAEMNVNEPLWLDSLRRAKQAGVKIAVGSDVGNRYLQGEQAIELGLLVKHGFSAEEALTAATRTAAQAIHRADQVGTLEVGKLGDLLVLNGDPMDDVAILRSREAFHRIVKGGEALAPQELAPEVIR
jgi:imidazolonepropionase-like amidohydrolase